MIIKIKKRTLEKGAIFSLFLAIFISVIVGVTFNTNYVIGEVTNITNVTVIAKLNVTNTDPNITSVTLNDDDTATPEIDLTANNITDVTCNATVWDFNGWADIDADSVNATLYMDSVGVNSPNDNNDHYTNRSCGRCIRIDSITAACDCRFAVQYYANDSNIWRCNISVTDRGGTGKPGEERNFTDSELSPLTTITKLLAIDTSTEIINYGNLSVTQLSRTIERNVTNGGNIDLNLTLSGFGGENTSVTNENVTMICQYGNISFGNHRYNVGTNVSFSLKKNLTNQTVDTQFTFLQRTNDNDVGIRHDINTTFWNLQIPLGVGGLCNGTIIFGSVEAG